jgi:hypothetical protein
MGAESSGVMDAEASHSAVEDAVERVTLRAACMREDGSVEKACGAM